MAKRMYAGVNGLARKVKKIYAGADGLARKVKKGYMGVGGVARPFFSGGELVYHGRLNSTTSNPIAGGAAESNSRYALFGGGHLSTNNTFRYNTVDAIDQELVMIPAPSLCRRKNSIGIARTGDSVLFAGGIFGSNYSRDDNIDSYDTELIKTTFPMAPFVGGLMGHTFRGFAWFTGGSNSDSEYLGRTFRYSANEVYDYMENLIKPRKVIAAAHTDNYIFFAYGRAGSAYLDKSIDAYDANSVHILGTSIADKTSTSNTDMVPSASFPGKVLFKPTPHGSTQEPKMIIYDKNLIYTIINAPDDINSTCEMLDDLAVFRKNRRTSYCGSDLVFTSMEDETTLDIAETYTPTHAVIGNYAVWGTIEKSLDAYTIQ